MGFFLWAKQVMGQEKKDCYRNRRGKTIGEKKSWGPDRETGRPECFSGFCEGHPKKQRGIIMESRET